MTIFEAVRKIKEHSEKSTKARDKAIDRIQDRLEKRETKFEKSIVKRYAKTNHISMREAQEEIEENL